MPKYLVTPFVLLLCLLCACSPKISLISGPKEALEEQVLSGAGNRKILLLPVRGMLSTSPGSGLVTTRPSIVHEVTARLEKAAKDDAVKALVLSIDSPGGTVTASDILYHSIRRFKEKSGAKVVAMLLEVAASGGYYTAAAADRIVAHPTTLTGSIGTIFIRPDAAGLMEKLGIRAEITKSGELKDMGSFMRGSTPKEQAMFQTIIDQLNQRFLSVVTKSRHLTNAQLATVRDGRVMTAGQALNLGLVDSLGYATDAMNLAKRLAGLPDDAKVITYRREEYEDDSPYNTILNQSPASPSLIRTGLPEGLLSVPHTGFYYLWAPEYAQ